MQRENSDLELSIDRALATYANPAVGEPHKLAAGALRRIETHRARRRRWRLIFAMAAPAFAMLMLIVFLLPRHTPAPERQMAAVVRPSVVPRSAPMPHVVRAHTARVHRRIMKQRRLPKLEQFPTRQPPSEQALLLAKFVENAPAGVVDTIVKQQQHPPGPLQISRLHIPPLATN